MSVVNESDLHDYFALYSQYELASDASLIRELDDRLSRYKDRFHKNAETLLRLLSAKESEFLPAYENAYRDLVFDLRVHAETIQSVKDTHRYDAERDVWVRK